MMMQNMFQQGKQTETRTQLGLFVLHYILYVSPSPIFEFINTISPNTFLYKVPTLAWPFCFVASENVIVDIVHNNQLVGVAPQKPAGSYEHGFVHTCRL